MGRPVGSKNKKKPTVKVINAALQERPTPAHYIVLEHAIVGIGVKKNDIPRDFETVEELLVWADTIRWAGGDQHARSGLMDRVSSKAARLNFNAEVKGRGAIAAISNVNPSAAEKYMSKLELSLTSDDAGDDEDLTEDRILN